MVNTKTTVHTLRAVPMCAKFTQDRYDSSIFIYLILLYFTSGLAFCQYILDRVSLQITRPRIAMKRQSVLISSNKSAVLNGYVNLHGCHQMLLFEVSP